MGAQVSVPKPAGRIQVKKEFSSDTEKDDIARYAKALGWSSWWGYIFLVVDGLFLLAHIACFIAAEASIGSAANDLLVGILLSLHFLTGMPALLDTIQNLRTNANALEFYGTPYARPRLAVIAAQFFNLWTTLLTAAFAYKFKSNDVQRAYSLVLAAETVAILIYTMTAFTLNDTVKIAPLMFQIEAPETAAADASEPAKVAARRYSVRV